MAELVLGLAALRREHGRRVVVLPLQNELGAGADWEDLSAPGQQQGWQKTNHNLRVLFIVE